MIISALAIGLMVFGRRATFWGSLVAVIIFVILTGAATSVVRAGFLAMLVVWGRSLGRQPYYPILILLTASSMLLFNPYALRHDISFQLSFLAFTGLVFLAPKINDLELIKILPEKILQIFTETMSAQIMVLPILIYNFGNLSLVAPLANILILPTIPLAMLLGFLTGLTGIFWLSLAKILGWVAWLLPKYIIVVAETLGRLPWAAFSLKTNEWWWIVLYYAIIILLIKQSQNSKLISQNDS